MGGAAAATVARIATFANYSPHATVLKSANKLASGDWPEWAAQMAEARYGGTGLGSVGTSDARTSAPRAASRGAGSARRG